METIIKLGAKAAPYFIAITMAIYGVQHFIYLKFVADFIPAWIPWRTFWAALTGVALIASALGIVLKTWDRQAATLLGAMIFAWVVLLHTSRIASQPRNPDEWRGFFQALSMSGFVFVLAGVLRGEVRTRLRAGPSAPVLEYMCDLGSRFASQTIAISMIALGFLHFVFPEAAGPKVPVWIPGNVPGTYITGLGLVASGIGILFRGTARLASFFLGLMIFFSMLLIHLPVVLRSPRFESDWCKTLVMSGGAFLLASQLGGKKKETMENRVPNSGVAVH